jgi:MoxR-like ATPase
MVYEEIKQSVLKKEDPFKDIIGQDSIKHQLKSTLLSNRHTIIVGSPGIGKTTLAKNISKLIKDASFVRIQGSPDLTVEDLLGDIDPIKALKFGPLSKEAFNPGKIFKADNGVLFFDELNRCPEKLQNALLQVLQEGKATIGSYDVDIPANFIFIATMNPEDTSTEKLSDVLLDRFDVIYMSYPETIELEKEIVKANSKQLIKVDESLLNLMTYFVRLLREGKDLEKKPSVRASIGLYERAQANALLKNKKKADLDDVKEAVISVLAHRIRLKPSIKYLKSREEFIKEQFEEVLKSPAAKEIKESGDG